MLKVEDKSRMEISQVRFFRSVIGVTLRGEGITSENIK
jgi:hypothetical protein